MKKRLSLLVAVLMLFSLVPASAFAVTTNHSSVVHVNNIEQTDVYFGTTIELKGVDNKTVLDYFQKLIGNHSNETTRGTIHVRLNGANADFKPLADGTRDVKVLLKFEGDKNLKELSQGTNHENTVSRYLKMEGKRIFNGNQYIGDIDNLKEIQVNGYVRFNYSPDGDYDVIYDLESIGLGQYKHKFATIKDDGGLFLNRLVDIKPVARGLHRQTSSFQVKGHQGDIVLLRLPSDDFSWDITNQHLHGAELYNEKLGLIKGQIISWKHITQLGEFATWEAAEAARVASNISTYKVVRNDETGKYEIVEPIYSIESEKSVFPDFKEGRDVLIRLTSNKAIVEGYINVGKDAAKGEIEIEAFKRTVYKENNEYKYQRTLITDRLVIADHVDYGIKLELLKPLKEVLANGDTHRIDVKVKTTDKDLLTRYIDFEVEGADVKVIKNNDALSGPAVGDFDSEFTWTYPVARQAGTKDTINSNVNEFVLRLEISPDWDASGDVVLKAKPRGMEEVSLTILKVKPVAKMEVEMKEVLGGDSKVAVSDIVITETQGRALKSGDMFGITLKGLKFEDAKFDSKGKIEAEGIAVKGYTLDKDSQTLYFTINSYSKKDAPAKITLKDLEVVSSRALPFGTHKLTFVHVGEFNNDKEKKGVKYAYTSTKHAALATINDAEFIKVVDKMSKVKKTTVFTLGSADYTVEGQAMKLDTPVFTQDNYTMLPVRAIADALGVEVVWNQENLTATFIDGDIVVSVTQNAKTLYKNGNSYPMVTKATVKADRMFIPVSSVGDAFGLTRGYDYLYDTTSKKVTIYPKLEAAKEVAVEKTEKVEETKPAK